MYKYLEMFEEIIDAVISNESEDTFEEFKDRVIERLNEID